MKLYWQTAKEYAKMMFVVERKAFAKVMSAGGQADHVTADKPPRELEAATPVATMVMKMAMRMEPKSM